jgi:hypothetical protein
LRPSQELKGEYKNVEHICMINIIFFSLVYLNLAVSSIQNEDVLQNVICRELPNLKALNIDYCEQVNMYKSIFFEIGEKIRDRQNEICGIADRIFLPIFLRDRIRADNPLVRICGISRGIF